MILWLIKRALIGGALGAAVILLSKHLVSKAEPDWWALPYLSSWIRPDGMTAVVVTTILISFAMGLLGLLFGKKS